MNEEYKVTRKKQVLDFIIKTMNGMAYGLFATLIVGTILSTIAGFFNDTSYIGNLINIVAKFLQNMTGVGIGIGVAWSLKIDGLKMVTLAAVGGIASYLNVNIYSPTILELNNLFIVNNGISYSALRIGDPLTIYLVIIGTILITKLVLFKKTPVDIVFFVKSCTQFNQYKYIYSTLSHINKRLYYFTVLCKAVKGYFD